MQFSFFITWSMATFAVASPLGSRSDNDVVVDETSPAPLIEWADTKKVMRATEDDEEALPVPLLEWADTKKNLEVAMFHKTGVLSGIGKSFVLKTRLAI
ncbi:hypothetical protein EYC84_001397 [Monilinia fructicola]|uniref:Uncharacterized protein n=1 Tax=Monilinia fructicola TaxID=38448 RepID=A0A5M9JPI4_MONFR|nr:hypothetical protein EYC84_001397 [Monilinia fructicola]